MAKKQLNSDFIIIHRPLIRDRRVSDGGYRLYCYLVDRRNDKYGGIVWVNQATMAKDLGLSVPSIVKRLNELEDVGLVIPDKMVFWPESGDRVIGRNKLQYKVLPTNEFYSPDELKENWNLKTNEKDISNINKSKNTKSKESLVSTTKENIGSIKQDLTEQNSVDQYSDEHSHILSELHKENISIQEGEEINKNEAKVLIHYQKTLEENHRFDYPLEYNKKDLTSIRVAIERYGVAEVLRIITHAIKNWREIVERHTKIEGSFFSIRTLGSGWLDVLEVDCVFEARMMKADKYFTELMSKQDSKLNEIKRP